jgi:hypothetical protein
MSWRRRVEPICRINRPVRQASRRSGATPHSIVQLIEINPFDGARIEFGRDGPLLATRAI